MNCNLDELKWLHEIFSHSPLPEFDEVPPYEIIIKKREKLCQFIQQAYLVWKDLEDISYTHSTLMNYLIKEIEEKYHA